MPTAGIVIALLLLVLLCGVQADDAPPAPALTLSTMQTSAEVGRTFTITCNLPTNGCAANYTATAVQWATPNGTLVPPGDTRLTSANGTLSCSAARLDDTGYYNCTLDPCGLSTAAYVLVYEMPTYAVPLAVLFSIDGGLAIVAVVLCTLSIVMTRKSASGIV